MKVAGNKQEFGVSRKTVLGKLKVLSGN